MQPLKDSLRKPRSPLVRARGACGVSQSGLAQTIGMSAAWLSGVETGKITASLQQRIAIARALNMPLGLLFSEDTDEDIDE